jgi:zinc-ribbon domain
VANFCSNCGNPLNETSVFCGACGARVPQANVELAASPISSLPPNSPPTAAGSLPPTSPLPSVSPLPPVTQGSSPVVKIVLIVLLVLVVGGVLSLAGLFYALHLASRKAHELSRQVLGSGALQSDSSSGGKQYGAAAGPGDCRLLSKEDVSRAIGVAIVETKPTDTGCEYLAKGTPADLTAKHLAAMMASRGANPQEQRMIQSLSRGLFGSAQDQAESAPNVNSVAMAFTIDPNAAKTQMSMNESVLGGMSPGGKPLKGIGDEAFDASGAVMMVRKGDTLIRITYSTCPCTIDAIKPLAQELAGAL